MTLTHEQLQRRVQQGLHVVGVTNSAPTLPILEVTNPLKASMTNTSDASFSTIDRLKGKVIETILPLLNLTSYNNLKRARLIANDYNIQATLLGAKLAQHDQKYNALYTTLTQQLREKEEIYSQKDAHSTQQLAELNHTIIELQSALASQKETLSQALQAAATELQEATTALQVSDVHRQITEENVKHLKERLDYLEWQNKTLLTMLRRYTTLATQTPSVDASSILMMIERVTEQLHDPATRANVRDSMLKYFQNDGDPNFSTVIELFEQADREQVPFWDIRTSARVLSNLIKPERYLEIGTRRGWSLAQVLIEAPQAQCYIFDMWVDKYADAQGSPTHVLEKMQQITGAEPRLVFINGNSHSTLPLFFQGKMGITPPESFDLITVDGDHSLLGAWEDLYDIFPKVRVGGAILFDDLDYAGEPYAGVSEYERDPMPSSVKTLRDVWHQFQARYPNFIFIDCFNLRFQAGIAIRMR